MARFIRKAVVLGSGVMGAGIAAHLVNAGIPVLLLDIVPEKVTPAEQTLGLTLQDKEVRNRLSDSARKQLLKQKPAPLTSTKNLVLIETGNMEDDLERLEEADWIIEAVVENVAVKKHVLGLVDKHRHPTAIVSSNTSGISIHEMVKGRTQSFQSHFLGTHFFNPPRYLKLLEIIPHSETKSSVLECMVKFAEDILGKEVVQAKDTPNFISNRIGTYGLLITVQEMLKRGWTIGETDSVTGEVIGRPKSATFRTLDVVGLDTFLYVAKNVYEQADDKERAVFKPPVFMEEMAARGWNGSKAGQGFYKKQADKEGNVILELNPDSLTYEPRKQVSTAAIEQAKQAKTVAEKLNTLVYADDKAGQFVWSVLKPVLLYAAEKMPEIANNITAVDDAVKWGFGWEMGPFETWDSLGVKKAAAKMKKDGETLPAWVEEMVEKGFDSFYKNSHTFYHKGKYQEKKQNPKAISVIADRDRTSVIFKNAGASLIDIGDEVAYLEFHSSNNSIGPDILHMITKSVSETEKNYKGLVIGSTGKNFCVGANLLMILMEAQDDNFFELDMVVRQFQKTTAQIRYAKRPIVAAPHGMTLGGGAEVCLASTSIQASSETYMGLVETGVGLIPGGGGNKELYLRHIEGIPADRSVDLLQAANLVFEKIALANVSNSAAEAKENGYLGAADSIVKNEAHRVYQAKQEVLSLDKKGFSPRRRAKIPVVGETGYAVMKLGAKMMQYGGMATDHDVKIADKLAFVLAGGRVSQGTFVDEQYLLDLEREAFLSLIGEPKTQQRIQHMITKGKPLRN
ncbi:3-hydroxyacyl-CoA dehydrogenase/enoyl-CoA hydratase family protein [Bacillus piscicola]|uniref:3-hydroxyacyl-CoA dehydrogenase/enoyl-CoA hydratase family protein n=1 Tax=Bacillus piscicola TaxID=1632684 RepID=UPI001F0950B2|nr:3-hydroxyacyl-CoA dehydrogenase/enoyl-CoA hydratase family protein [Bacillus piscicola]